MKKAFEIQKYFDYRCKATAFTGSACSLIAGAETINSVFNIPVHQKKGEGYGKNKIIGQATGPQHALALHTQTALWKSLQGIVLDEVSMTDACLLGKASQQVQQFVNNLEKPFGGLDYILSGDFYQLPPVQGTSLPIDVLIHNGIKDPPVKSLENDSNYDAATHPRAHGIQIFQACKLRILRQQKRAEKDVNHTKFLQDMRDHNCPDPFLRALLDALSARQLTAKDLDSQEWDLAPVCVTSNAERFSLMVIMALNFAKKRGLPVVVWRYAVDAKHPDANKQKAPKDFRPLLMAVRGDPRLNNQLFRPDNGTMGIFVKGAPAYIEQNVNTSKNLANGTFVTMHSLVFDESAGKAHQVRAIQQLVDTAPVGEILKIAMSPAFINVVHDPIREDLQEKPWSPDKTVVQGEIVVPMPMSDKKRVLNVIIDYNAVGIDQKQTLGVELLVYRVTLGFAPSYHHSQATRSDCL
jgi:hypothetical protein